MMLDIQAAAPVPAQPWHPRYAPGGTRHGFRNPGSTPLEILETFVR